MSANTHIEPVLILGGGLAGLSTAYHLRRPWLLVEKESRVGGLVRTETMHGGFRFDPTGHWLHLRDAGMKALVHERLLPDGLSPWRGERRSSPGECSPGFPTR